MHTNRVVGKTNRYKSTITDAFTGTTVHILTQRSTDLRHHLVPIKKDNSDDVKKPLPVAEYTAKRKQAYKVHSGPLFNQICELHQMSLASLSMKGGGA